MGFKIYDISNILNPVKLSYLDVFNDADDFIVTQDLELLIVGNGVLGITMVDIQDKTNPFIITNWFAPNSASVENIEFYKNESFVLVSMRKYGFAIIEINQNRNQFI